MTARWHLRVDDDSITDVAGLLGYADERFGLAPIHLMSSPSCTEIGPPIYENYFARKGIKPPSMLFEYESSLTSASAMKAMLANGRSTSFLAETGALFAGPGDRALALAMHLANVPSAPCPIMTKDFCRAEMSVLGGRYCHVHYVDWTDTGFTAMLDAVVHAEDRALCDDDVLEILGRRLEFGRGIGGFISTLTLLESGVIEGASHANEARWERSGPSLVLTRPDGLPTTIFRTILSYENRRWLTGPYLEEDIYHYLCLNEAGLP